MSERPRESGMIYNVGVIRLLNLADRKWADFMVLRNVLEEIMTRRLWEKIINAVIV